ncbi:MAG: DUF3617 domain-containing protein [Elusimicrobiota bacterium]|nr:MAG: DUF3617 domain-containing protein [Elusimicrobiota bacterium]
MKITLLLAALLALVPAHAFAEEGELWEVSTKMEMPDMPEGMPAGMGPMGGRTMKMCRGNDPKDTFKDDKEMKDCEMKDIKQTDTTVSMSMVCKKGRTAKMEIVYNKARTEYKGTMRVKDGGDEMTMRMTGKKLGPCDAGKARAETDAMISKHKAAAADAEAQYNAMVKKSEKDQVKTCAKALDTMNPDDFGFHGYCRNNKKDKNCKSLLADYQKGQPVVAEECSKKADLFCENFGTTAGFLKVGSASRRETAGRMCGEDADDLKKKLCKTAEKTEDYEFIGALCPKQAKPLAKKHCAGRSYTVKEGDPRRVEKKWFKFCKAVASAALEGDEELSEALTPERATKAAKDEAKDEAKKAAKGAAVDALKGLFGR